MSPSQRIVLNTVATYTRSILGVGLALFSSRWVLKALGQSDFGLFSMVGSLIVFVTFLNSVMAGSAARHYAFSIGQGDAMEVNRWFNAALSIHIVLATALVLIGWPVGEYLITHVLTIQPDRVPSSLWVFHLSLISAFVTMVSIPFVAMFTAKQHIAEIGAWGVLTSLMTFVLAWLLTRLHGDRLRYYAVGMVSIVVFVQLMQILRALAIFNECRVNRRQWFDRRRFKELFSFASWSLIGSFGAILRDHGSAILLNIHFGTRINAAYGIANQVSVQTNNLAAAMIGAFSPEITASEGRGDRERMLSLADRASKLGTILVLLFAVPLILEMDYVLKLWLVEPPPHAVVFCQLMLGTFLIDRLTTGYMLAVGAYGKIAGYQATLGIALLLTLPLAWLFVKSGLPPTSVGVAFVSTMLVCSFGRVFWMRRLLGVPIKRWLTTVVRPCAVVGLGAALVPFGLRCVLPSTLARLMLGTAASVLLSLLVSWFFALDRKERRFIVDNVKKAGRKLGVLAFRRRRDSAIA
jgi:O-antigen/teichoic acid export membrane protein